MSLRLNQNQNWPELARQAKWSAAALAENCGVSRRTLHRHFLANWGMNTKTWLAEQRLRDALELLCDGSSVKETAAYLGYKQQSSLTRRYKHQTGICPSLQPPTIATDKPTLSANDKQCPQMLQHSPSQPLAAV